MSRVSQLNDLQEIDREIMARDASLRDVESRMGESEEIAAAREALTDMRLRIEDLSKAQRESEWQGEDLRTRIAGFEAKLYGGSVTNSKELVSIQEEVGMLNAARAKVEESLLGIMEQLDGLQRDIQAHGSRITEMEDAWTQEQEDLRREQARLNSELELFRARRNVFAAYIDPKDLSLYENLLANKGGRAVSRVERNACQGCRITIAMNQLHRARSGQEIVQCPSCQRILYAS